MLTWLMTRLSRAGVRSRRGKMQLGDLGRLARSGPAVWILTQEKARLNYLAAKEEYERRRSRRAYKRLTDHLLQLQSTNAIITSLINEHFLERALVSAPPAEARRSA